MKRLIGITALCILLCILCACQEKRLTVNGMSFVIEDGYATLTQFSGGTNEVNVPETVDGYPVIAIGEGAFARAKAITNVKLPSSVRQIGDYAFAQCTALVSVTFQGDRLTTIGVNAFAGCHALNTITLPQGVKTIKKQAFSDCILLESVYLPGTVTEIGDRAFEECRSLTSLQLPLLLESCGEYLFAGCSQLTLTVFEDSYGQQYAMEYGIPMQVEED